MKVSAFTFVRNGQLLGYPFIASIQSVLPIVDEFIVNVGDSEDDTLAMVKALDSDKIKIVNTTWNENMTQKGFTYGQQKMIAQYHCTGDWAFYLESDEVLHEKYLPVIKKTMERELNNDKVEALIFDYIHFYGNINTYLWSPHWYRRAPRIIRNTIRSFAPDGLFWTVLDKNNKKARYPNAALANATIYHYGWVRTEQQMLNKLNKTIRYRNKGGTDSFSYQDIDPHIIREFKGTHPTVVEGLFTQAPGVFQVNPDYKPTLREKKHRIALALEKRFGLNFSKTHYQLCKTTT